MSFVTTPSPPRATTAPSKSGSPREKTAISPLDVTTSSEGAATIARAVGRGRTGAGNGDVRQRREVMQSEPDGIQRAAQLPVADAPVHGQGPGRAVQEEDARHPGQRDELARRIGDVVERMARSEHPQ